MNSSALKSSSSKTMLPIVRGTLEKARQALGQSNLRILLALSGGVDSVVLAHFLASLPKSDSLELVLAHFNHGLREESNEEESFVQNFADQIGVEVYIERAPKFDGKTNVEAWARAQRYKFLESIRLISGCDLIATAHHQKDQAETMLMRFLNGRLATSAKGIAELDIKRKLVRPILLCPKNVVDSYAVDANIKHVHDHSNDDLDRSRNWIRHQLLPLLEENISSSLCSTMSYVAQRLSDDEQFLIGTAARILDEEKDVEKVAYLRSVPAGIRWRLLLLIAQQQLGDDAAEIGYLAFKRLSNSIFHLDTFEMKEIELGSSWRCQFRMKGVLKFFRA
jgi:tRNA(Ile)-lysidine synthetase-like protein